MTANSNPILVPIKSRVVTVSTNNGVTTESGNLVQIGSAQYNASPLIEGALGGFQVCIVTADTLDLVANESFSTNHGDPQIANEQMQNMMDLLNEQGRSGAPVVIISSLGSQPIGTSVFMTNNAPNPANYWVGLYMAVEALGAGRFYNLPGENATYSLIGQLGAGSFSGAELSSQTHTGHGYFSSNIEGYLQQGVNGHYHFMYPEFIDFQLPATGSSAGGPVQGLSVDGKFYPSALGNGTAGGFQVGVFKRDTLEFVANESFATGGALPQPPQQAMGDFISGYDNSVLMFIAGLGDNPLGIASSEQSQMPSATTYLIEQLSRLGTNDILQMISNGVTGYSLIGHPGLSGGEAVESGMSGISGGSSHLIGKLRKDNSGWYRPFIYTSDESVNNDLYSIIYQTPETFPAMDADETLAYQYISGKASPGGTGIRSDYADLNIAISSLRGVVSSLSYPVSPGFSQTAFNTMQSQLSTELQYAADVRSLFNNIRYLNGRLLNSRKNDLVVVRGKLQVTEQNDDSKTNMFWLGLLRTALMVATIVDPEPVSKAALGVAAAGLFLGMTYENTIGNPAVKTTQYLVSQLEISVSNAFEAASEATAVYETIALTDWGKLQAIGRKIDRAEPGWTWSPTETDKIVENMETGFRLSFYQALMPIKWRIIRFGEMSSSSPKDYSYKSVSGGYLAGYTTVRPYDNAPDAASWAVGSSSAGYSVWLLTDNDGNYPSADLTTDLFTTLNVPRFEFYNGLKGWNLNFVAPEGSD